MDKEMYTLTEAASSAKRKAYSPYSRFNVGAAIQSTDGKIFVGCNIENVSYGLSMCAERVALYKAISEGFRSFDALAISSSGVRPALPCGACRQVLAEFNPNLKIILEGRSQFYSLSDLMSHPFTRDQMILNERDRTILGTTYFKLLCEKTKENIGRRNRFSKVEVYGSQQLDAYNRDIVLPLIIRKLNQMGYIHEHDNAEISLTSLGTQHCGEVVVLDEGI